MRLSWLFGRRRPVLVDQIRCPHCRLWVKPRRFDLQHMACKTCRRTLARPRWWLL